MTGKILAVDPGEKRIGVAISDETRSLARGFAVIKHVSLNADCLEILQLAQENEIALIIIGDAIGEEGQETPQSRHAQKIAEMLTQFSDLQVALWDERGSTREARAIRLQAGANRSKRAGHLDEVAAAVILQSWLDANHEIEKRHA